MSHTLYSLIFILCMPLVLLRLLYRARKAPAYARRWHERFAVGGDLRSGGSGFTRYRWARRLRLRRCCDN